MPDRPETWAFIAEWANQHWSQFSAALLCALITGLRVLYGGGTWREAIIEAPLCGGITLAMISGADLIGLSKTEHAAFIAGCVGLLGARWFSEKIKNGLQKKVDQA